MGTHTINASYSGDGNFNPHTAARFTQTVQGPAVSLSRTSLSFGTQYLGTTSAPQIVTLTNTGSAALSISSVTIGPDSGQTNNCGNSVAPGASCTFNVTFTPTVTGTLNESLTISNKAAGSPQSVSLTGIGAPPPVAGVSVTPSTLNFGNQVVGTTGPSQPATLTNTGNAVLTITSIVPAGDFALATTASSRPYADGNVNPGATCTIDVTYTPTIVGAETGSVTVTDNALGSPRSVSLSGTGLAATANSLPQLDLPVVPGVISPGASSLTLTASGTGFVSGSAVNWNGAALATTFVSNRQLTATVPAADVSAAATAWITVVNPPTGGGASNTVFLPVTNPTSSLTLGQCDQATGNGPVWVGTADFNRDDKLDLAIVNGIDGTASILLGNGDGTFTAEPTISGASALTSAAVGDVNGDGIPDLAVVRGTSNSVSILLGNGNGTFTIGTAVNPGNGPAAAALADGNVLSVALATTKSSLPSHRNLEHQRLGWRESPNRGSERDGNGIEGPSLCCATGNADRPLATSCSFFLSLVSIFLLVTRHCFSQQHLKFTLPRTNLAAMRTPGVLQASIRHVGQLAIFVLLPS